MKLSKLYCSNNNVFQPIFFNDGLNIVLAEKRDPMNKTKSTHDLGKTLLATVIDYCLLKEVRKDYFLKKNKKLFSDLVFYLEIKLNNGEFCTIRRAVQGKNQVSLAMHNEQVFFDENSYWDFNGGIRKAKIKLNDILQFNVLPTREYRATLPYFLRAPQSFGNVFRTVNFIQNQDVEWKPIIAELLGFKSEIIVEKYILDYKISNVKEEIKQLTNNNTLNNSARYDKEFALLQVKKDMLLNKEKVIKTLNLKVPDENIMSILVEDIDKDIQQLLVDNYYKKTQLRKAKSSLMDFKVNFEAIEELYSQINIYFSSQLVKDYDDVIDFNEQLFQERNQILAEIIEESSNKIKFNENKIEELNNTKSDLMEYIRSEDSFDKLKILEREIIDLKVGIEQIEKEINIVNDTKELELQNQELDIDQANVVYDLKKEIYKENEILASIKKNFLGIIYSTLGEGATIDVKLNGKKNIEFHAEIVDLQNARQSSRDKGTTYKKLMCCAFDLAVLATYYECSYFHFVYHDGVFDGLDSRQKNNYYEVIQKYVSEFDIQYIFSVIEDELPPDIKDLDVLKEKGAVIRVLHDMGNTGRLFNVDPF
ncbi:DUF2326 domain-containing protein [Bacillus cereus group sp. BfR-BA-01495]|uniref:DUF2326 domain-containing protein n=1 Tax=Bacillus cereus group sp. BfR-BA-01495 TaxID=2920363 RepID=UPI001F58D367|nr:DUF2326 domain-containing protein [Bacillus cereus group sp. BfR-BA-01495]